MNHANTRPEISEGAQELLRITMENDRYGALARNAALLEAMDWLRRLRLASEDSALASLQTLLEGQVSPKTFLELTCATIGCIQANLDRRYDAPIKSAEPLVTDFNRHVFQALAETLADMTWPDRDAQDFDGPPLKQVANRLAARNLSEIWQSLLKNYLGNILQDCFASARIRERVPDLDPATEMNLRSQDSDLIASFVMQEVRRKSPNPEFRLIIAELKTAIEAICR